MTTVIICVLSIALAIVINLLVRKNTKLNNLEEQNLRLQTENEIQKTRLYNAKEIELSLERKLQELITENGIKDDSIVAFINYQRELKRDVRIYENMYNNQKGVNKTLAEVNLRLQNIINDYQIHPLKYLRITTSKHNEKASIRLKFNEEFNQYEAVPYGCIDTIQEVKLLEHIKEEEEKELIFVSNKEEPIIYKDSSKTEEDKKEEAPE